MSSVEDRLSAVECELARLRQQLQRDPSWIVRISGSMKDYPEFDEVLRFGRDARRNDPPRSPNGENGN